MKFCKSRVLAAFAMCLFVSTAFPQEFPPSVSEGALRGVVLGEITDLSASELGELDLNSDGVVDVADSDLDNDTIANNLDNCPATANTNQNDTDGDTIGDACDSVDNSPIVVDPPVDDDESAQRDNKATVARNVFATTTTVLAIAVIALVVFVFGKRRDDVAIANDFEEE